MSGKLKPLFTWRSAITESELPPKARLVALTLSLHMSERGDSCWPAIKTLAEESGLSRRSVQDAITVLAEHGYLSVERGGGRGHSSHYQARIPERVQALHRLEPERVQTTTIKGAARAPEDVKRALKTEEANASSPTPNGNRAPDPLWDLLVAELGEPATRSERGRRNKALKELRDVGASVDEVRHRIAAYLRRWPNVELTATALAANWSLLGRAPGGELSEAERHRRFREHHEAAGRL